MVDIQEGQKFNHIVRVPNIDGYFEPWEQKGVVLLRVARVFGEAAGLGCNPHTEARSSREYPDAASDAMLVYHPGKSGDDDPVMIWRRIGEKPRFGKGLFLTDKFGVEIRGLEGNWEQIEREALCKLAEDYPEQPRWSLLRAFELFCWGFSQSSSGGRGLW